MSERLTNLELIRSTYEGNSAQNAQCVRAALADDASWTEAAGFPYAGTYVGPDEIFAKVFNRLATEWIDSRAEVRTYLADGDMVAAFGVYFGVYRATGKSMSASFSHLYRLHDSKITSMQQCVDSAIVQSAMGIGSSGAWHALDRYPG